jgi:anti-sigma B factor antagonist
MTEVSKYALFPEMQLFWRLDKESKLKLSLETSINEDVVVVSCKGRVVYRDEAAALSRKVMELLPRARLLVLELSQVEMVDGAGLGELVALFRRAEASGCIIKLAGPSSRVREMLELTRLASIFDIHPTLDAAILSARGQVA